MSRYANAHEKPAGPGDARPTAMQIVRDEDREMNMKDKVGLPSNPTRPQLSIRPLAARSSILRH